MSLRSLSSEGVPSRFYPLTANETKQCEEAGGTILLYQHSDASGED